MATIDLTRDGDSDNDYNNMKKKPANNVMKKKLAKDSDMLAVDDVVKVLPVASSSSSSVDMMKKPANIGMKKKRAKNSDILSVYGAVKVMPVASSSSSSVDMMKKKPANSVLMKKKRAKSPDILSVHDVINVDREPEVQPVASSSASVDRTVAAASRIFSNSKKRKRFSCGICLEGNLESYTGYSMNACQHRFCISCLTELVGSAVDSSTAASSTLKIKCPHEACHCTLSLSDVEYILRYNPVMWNKYSIQVNLCQLESQVVDRGSHMRRCPARNCNFIFEFQPGKGTEGTPFDCPLCHESFCLKCGANGGKVGPSHPRLTCLERQQQLEKEEKERRLLEAWRVENSQADERFQQLLQSERQKGVTKPCPECKAPITKNGGCNHMYVCMHFAKGSDASFENSQSRILSLFLLLQALHSV